MQRRFVNEPRNQNDVPSEKNQAGIRQAVDGQWVRRQSALAQKWIEEAFAWIQATAEQKRTKFGSAPGLSPSRLRFIIARGCRSAVTKKPLSKPRARCS
jgi:hypothetical protein